MGVASGDSKVAGELTEPATTEPGPKHEADERDHEPESDEGFAEVCHAVAKVPRRLMRGK